MSAPEVRTDDQLWDHFLDVAQYAKKDADAIWKARRLIEERVIATERARADAWKTLHDAKGHGPYNYASQEQRQEIRDALAIVNGEAS